jgi:hypothetical protein
MKLKTAKIRKKYEEGYFAMLNQGSENYNPYHELSAIRFTGESLRLFLFYIGSVEYDNKIKYYKQREIAEITNISRANISEANNNLLNAGVIYKDGKNYYFNDKYVMKGLRQYRERLKS